ncbi:DUF1176 domain-containing protein [Devosia aurantiaca]|uniref:DUF1176 domain-containing protein n=1 Tax=Devosia aurantiaca TaxID=2714858 RepID=A0A6M1SCJ1_9HYPH|nr:DUF1176 domain-containing protein [Devosia aurantiaca]NGP17639.1 hypothetical protein [Devosia aurantiaca]
MIRPLLWLPVAALCLTPVVAQEASLLKQAEKLHALAAGQWCDGGWTGWDKERADPEQWTFSYAPSYDSENVQDITVIRLFCFAGAYNITHAYYWHREYEGLMPLSLAEPTFKATYADDDGLDGTLLDLKVTGMSASHVLTNSSFDPDTLTISSDAPWRGLGDASSQGTWMFVDGDFTLKRFDIDASYDGEINPQNVVDYTE